MVGAIADFFRFTWGILYWNGRKSLFQLGRGRFANPCQNPSDSGKAMETSCDACQHWDRPARFARVCPLLVATPRGLRCAVNSADVRPFWGKAVLFYGGILAAVYVLGVGSVFGYLRHIHFPVSLVQVGWPGQWHHITEQQSPYFLNQAHLSFAEGKPREALLDLENAYEADPLNYEAALENAENNQAGQPALADAIYGKLLLDHPENRARTSSLWLRSLLSRADYPQIARLASAEVVAEPEHANVWMRALIFSTRQSKDPATLLRLRQRRELAPWSRVLDAEILSYAPPDPTAAPVPAELWPSPQPAYAVYYQISALLDAYRTVEALDDLEQTRHRLDGPSRIMLRLKGLAMTGDNDLREQEIRGLFATSVAPATVELICAHLIAYPNAASLHVVYEALQRHENQITHENLGAWLSLFCAAGTERDFSLMTAIGVRLRNTPFAPVLVLEALESFFKKESAARRVTTFLPFVPLPLEVMYSLLAATPTPTGR